MSSEPSSNEAEIVRSWTVLDHENDSDLLRTLEATRLNNLASAAVPPCGMDFCSWEIDNPNGETSEEQSFDVEYERLRTLRSYGILETPRDARFERITALASRIFSVPIALVSLVDMGRQWFLSNRGLGECRETPRNLAFCAHAILSTHDLFIVNDASKDERFCHNALVTSEPHIRFYAGAPLVCPEGFKLGTLCIIDSVPRPDGLTLMEKQNLRELAAFVVDTMVQRRDEIQQANEDKYKIIACTAHDLLTPLFGIELNLSLLMDDGKLWRGMNNHQKDLVQSACSCTEMMSRICHDAINTYRGNLKKTKSNNNFSMNGKTSENISGNDNENNSGQVNISRLVKNLRTTIDSYPKRVPIFFEVAHDVPPVILSDDVKLFRSALNYLTNACKVTKDGSITFRIFVETTDAYSEGSNSISVARPKDNLVIEVDDSGPGININDYPGLFLAFRANNLHQQSSPANTPKSIGLGLSSVASNISSLGGDYGFTTKNKNGDRMRRCHSGASFSSLPSQGSNDNRSGSIFWFSIPIVVPNITKNDLNERKKPVMKEDVLKALDDLSKSFTADSSNHVPNTIQIDSSRKSIGELSAIAEVMEPPFTTSKGFSCTLSRKATSATAVQRQLYNKNSRRNSFEVPITHNISIPDKNEEDTTNRKKEALIIDDSVTIRKSIDRALKNLRFEVSQAENGMTGLQCLKSKEYDLVFCDFLMPIMDGLDCVKQYRTWEKDHRRGSRQYIIGISAHASPNDANCGLSSGMDMFLSKPLKLKTIKELVVSEHVLARSKMLDHKFLKLTLGEKATVTNSSASSSLDDQLSQSEVDMTRNDRSQILIDEVNSEVIHHVTGPVCLIAEDSKVVGKSLTHAIEKRGYRTSLVENGEDALRLLKMRNWDIVFLDEQMPLLSGSSCIARFRTWELRNRVVRQNNVYLLSGNVGNDGVNSNFTTPSGFDGAFGKPFKVQTLYELLESEEVRAQCDPEEIVLRY